LVERSLTGNPNVPRVAGLVFGTVKRIDRINKVDRMEKATARFILPASSA
jgi:hypothetical protein